MQTDYSDLQVLDSIAALSGQATYRTSDRAKVLPEKISGAKPRFGKASEERPQISTISETTWVSAMKNL